MTEEAPTGHEVLNAMAVMAEQMPDLPLQTICARLAELVAKMGDRLTEEEALEVVQVGGALWRKATSN